MTPRAEAGPADQRLRADIAGIAGERALPVVARTLSLQARLSNWLAMGVMLLVGGGLLLWYYGHQIGRGSRSRQQLEAGPARQASTEMKLPPLGPIEPAGAQEASAGAAGMIARSPAAGAALPAAPLPAAALPAALPSIAPLALEPALAEAAGSVHALPVPAVQPARAATARDRRLSGTVYVPLSGPQPPTGASQESTSPAGEALASGEAAVAVMPGAAASPGGAAMAAGADARPAVGLSSPLAAPTAARLLGRQSLVLPKGTSIDCTLETAIDSTLPGMTRCLTATDTFGADGRVVLLERGTELVGETQGQVQQGSARVYVLWSEARTPRGVIVPLESPGADELGRAGLPGTVQRHFWERFGAAILVSTIDGAVQAGVQASSQNSGTVIYNPGASQDVMTEVLRSTVAIPPTVRKANGDRIQVLVARDVDFNDVYELRPAGAAR